jgi:ABC-type polysaccharide/polyol phosphate transport system ATPase subunit
LGFIGPNGAGKTTLLRAAAGLYMPDEGSISVHGRVAPLLSLSAGLVPQLSGWENIALITVLLGSPRSDIPQLTPKIAEFSGLGEFLDAEVRTYSAGMMARLGFSVAAFADPDVLVVDEILAAGDHEFQERSGKVITSFIESGRTTLIASHQLQTLLVLCTRIAWLDHGRIVELGEPTEVVERYLRDVRA